MPTNTTNPNPGTPLEYQNPATVSAALDSETVGTDQVSGTQLTREFVVPQESVSSQDPLARMALALEKILKELRIIRSILALDSAPELVDDLSVDMEADDSAEEATLDSDGI